jgi:1-acyl-sn-glycerol-3-phosphate acyltransferase
MLRFLPPQILGTVSILLLIGNTFFWFPALFAIAIIKLIIPIDEWRRQCSKLLNGIARCWISCNNIGLRLTKEIQWDVKGIDGLKNRDWYLVLSNHQSWVDIVVLQKIFHKKIPFLKFFLKKELIWVPVMGFVWWALEYPFMKRYSQEFLRKNPQCAGKDMDITRKACNKFKKTPISVMNFVEGTRFTVEKHKKQKSPFMHLLRPKAGGIAFVLSAMDGQLRNILNVTIIYPQGVKGLWSFLCTDSIEIVVRVECIPVTNDLVGDYPTDERFKGHFQKWLNDLWIQKDHYIKELIQSRQV